MFSVIRERMAAIFNDKIYIEVRFGAIYDISRIIYAGEHPSSGLYKFFESENP